MSTDAYAAAAAPPDKVAAREPLVPIVRMLVGASLALVGVLGLLVCLRRLAGALVEPLPPLALVVLSVALAGMALAFRTGIRRPKATEPVAYAWWAAPSVVLLLWMAGVSLPGSSALALASFFGLLLVEEGWSWGQLRGDVTFATVPLPVANDPQPRAALLAEAPSGAMASLEEAFAAPDVEDESVTQFITRRREGEGEVIEGWTRVAIEPAQRHATTHVAICPPLDDVPECFAEQADGPPAQVKVAQVLTHGVRFELKLDEPAVEAGAVVIEFSILQHAPAGGEQGEPSD